MLSRRFFLTSAAVAAAAPYLFTTGASRSATPSEIAVMAKNIDDIVGGFDPAEAYEISNGEVCGSLYRNLVTVDRSNTTNIVGDLAESWEISPDGSTFTFKLRTDAFFESGNPVTSDDVAFSLQRVLKLGKGPSYSLAPLGWTAESADSMVHAEGPSVVKLSVSGGLSPEIVLSCLTTSGGCVVEKKSALANETKDDLGNAWLKAHSAGAGPYKLIEWLPRERIVLEANPHASIKPQIPRLIIRHVSDPATQLLLLQKGDIDIARDLGSDQLATIRGNPDFTMVKADSLTQIYMGMNMGVPELRSPQVRQALKWAIDYEAISKNITPDTWNVWQSVEPKGVPGAIAGSFHKDVAKAKALLAEAGFPNGFSMTLDHSAAKPFSDIAQAVQADLSAIGVQVELLAGEGSAVVTKMRARKHQLVIGLWSPEYLDSDYNASAFCVNRNDADDAKSKPPAWRHHFVDPEMIHIVDAAAKDLDPSRRKASYEKLQQQFFDRSPFAFILQEIATAVLRKGVSGLSLGAAPNFNNYTGITKA